MALRTVKRRKLSHSPSSSSSLQMDDGDASSESGSEVSVESQELLDADDMDDVLMNGTAAGNENGASGSEVEEDIEGDVSTGADDELDELDDEEANNSQSDNDSEQDDASEDGDENEEEAEAPTDQKTTTVKSTPARPQKNPRPSVAHDAAYVGEVYGSNTFKVQIDDLLESVKPKYGKKFASLDNALRSLKSVIEAIPERSPSSIEEAEKSLQKNDLVAIPFPNPKPPRDAKYKLQYARPANINVVGSYATKLAIRTDGEMVVDLAVTMPSSIFQEKDFQDYRYFYKRAYYLATIAAGIKNCTTHKYKIQYDTMNGNPLQPILVVRSIEDGGPDDFSSSKSCIHILPTMPEGILPARRLTPDKCCVRPRAADADINEVKLRPTPLYNSTLRSDMIVTSYLKLIHPATRSCEAFVDACILGKIWLRQRGFSSKVDRGGFGGFEWTALTALLLSNGEGKKAPLFSPSYSSYQLFKAALQFLASRDLAKQPYNIDGEGIAFNTKDGSPILFDGIRGINLLFKMTPWSYRKLRRETRSSLSMFSNTGFDQFQPSFILRADPLLYQYDLMVSLPVELGTVGSNDSANTSERSMELGRKLYSALTRGLNDRVRLVDLIFPKEDSWPVESHSSVLSNPSIIIGMIVDPQNFSRTVDHGPPAEKKKEAASFRQFWGEKAELRRFRDGSILESLVWTTKDADLPIFEQVVSYILARHFSIPIPGGLEFFGGQLWRMLSKGKAAAAPGIAPFQPVMSALKTLEDDIRGLEGLPLSVASILGSSPQLRYSSVEVATSESALASTAFANVVLSFEGSGRWPDDVAAIQRTKIAFLLKLGELLEDASGSIKARVGLENEHTELMNQAFLDVVYPNFAFRIRIQNEREQTLLERKLGDKSLMSVEREETAAVLSNYKRDFVRSPSHTQSLQILCSRFPMLSPTIRLVKKWFAAHCLQCHFTEEFIELLAIRTFTQPYPWTAPSSPSTGFLRTLFFLSRWDWRNEPLIIDLSSEGGGASKADEIATAMSAAKTRFQAWRNIDPALNRVVLFAATTSDPDGAAWTDHQRPPKVAAARMTALARAATEMVLEKGMQLEPATLFASSLSDYDFIVHLQPRFLGSEKRRSAGHSTEFKNLGLKKFSGGNKDMGNDSIGMYVDELTALFGRATELFYDGSATVAGLWKPPIAGEKTFKVKLGYSTVPTKANKRNEGVDKVTVNREGILAEMARLGGELVRKIEVNAK